MFAKTTRLALLLGTALALSACQDGSLHMPKHLRPVSAETVALMASRDMVQGSPIMVRIFKAEGQLEVWKQQRNGRFALLRSFEICRWSGDLGPKVREGDRQAPEGFYTVTPALMNPNSSFHLAFNTGFPNAFDRSHGRTGSHLMVHGDCSSRGCFAMTNAQMEEIYALARDSFGGGQRGIQLQIFPFRMTAENMFRYRRNENIAFWRMLKEGSDHFEATLRPPEVRVCGRRYVFNKQSTNPDARFDAQAACPPAEIPHEIRVQVAQRQARDQQVMASLESQYRAGQRTLGTMTPRLNLNGTALASNRPPHETFTTRQQILAALPSSSPEALSMLPGAETGPTPELRRIARGEMVGTPASATPAVSSTMVATAPAAAPSTTTAFAPGAGNGLLGGLLGAGQAPTIAQAPSAPASAVPIPLPNPTRVTAAATTPDAATPARSGEQRGLWDRFLGSVGVSRNPPPAARNDDGSR